MPTRPRVLPALAAHLLLALLLAACTGSTATKDAQTTTAAPATTGPHMPPQPAPVQWRGCGSRAECGTISVPVDYSQPAGETIDLAVVRQLAADPTRRIGSLFVNPGGPGVAGTDMARSLAGSTFNERFDIVGWDPRGVGGSAGLSCSHDPAVAAFRHADSSPDDEAEQVDLEQAAAAVSRACEQAGGHLLAHLHTDDVARDLHQLRQAVGDSKLTYLGFSYGTSIGEHYLELFPYDVRAMVLDGVVDPAQDLEALLAGQADAIEHSLLDSFAACKSSARCPIPDPLEAFERLADRVEGQPLGTGNRAVGPAELTTAAVMSTYDPSLSKAFIDAVAAAGNGNPAGLHSLAETYNSTGELGAYLGVFCTDSDHPATLDAFRSFAARLAASAPHVGAAVANELLPCVSWPARPAEQPAPIDIGGIPPVLVIGNTGDAATPYVQAQRVAASLPDSVLLTYQGGGHTAALRVPCVTSAAAAYLTDLVLPPAGTVCR